MNKKSVQEAQPILNKSQEDLQQLARTQSEITKEDDRKTFLPIAGGVITFVIITVCLFTILLILKVELIVQWGYWTLFSPILLALFVLLILTQSRTISTRFPLISRLAWLMCVLCLIAFVIMLILRMEGLDVEVGLEFEHIFIPLWILFGSSFILGLSAVFVAVCFSDTERRKSKYLTSGLPLIFGDIVFFPFVLLISFKLSEVQHLDFTWAYVFIPLFIADGFFICISAFLLLFTIGARDSALFTIGQIGCFLFSLPAAIVFKILLVMELDSHHMPFYIVCIPMFFTYAMFLTCGLNLLCTKPKSPPSDVKVVARLRMSIENPEINR